MDGSDYKDLHRGETCLVIGNGPSLRDVPDDFLSKFPNIGTNRIYLRHVPDYYVAINPLVVDQCADEIDALKCDAKFIRASHAHMIAYCHPLYSGSKVGFSTNPLKAIWEGYTVTYVALQIAYWMGFETVLLVGLDHRYDSLGLPPNRQAYMEGDDPNHFDSGYFKGKHWHTPDLANSAKAYAIAKQAYEDSGRRVINLTPNTAETVFEHDNIERWL